MYSHTYYICIMFVPGREWCTPLKGIIASVICSVPAERASSTDLDSGDQTFVRGMFWVCLQMGDPPQKRDEEEEEEDEEEEEEEEEEK